MISTLALVIGAAVGVVLGLLGAGGSLLTVPALTFFLGLSITEATGTSLVAVALMAASGLAAHGRAGRCRCKPGLLFASAGILTAAGSGYLADSVPKAWLNGAFIVLLLGTAVWLWRTREERPDATEITPSTPRMLASGAGVGVLTGFLGVGGGFIVVPALIATLGLPVELAVGTSQLVVLTNALAGMIGRLSGSSIDWATGLAFGLGGVGGAWLGSWLSERLSSARMKVAFAGVAVVVAVAMAVQAFAGGGGATA